VSAELDKKNKEQLLHVLKVIADNYLISFKAEHFTKDEGSDTYHSTSRVVDDSRTFITITAEIKWKDEKK